MSSWEGDFADEMETGIIALLETRYKRGRNGGRNYTKQAEVEAWKASGILLPGADRDILGPDDNSVTGCYDLSNDPLPTYGMVALSRIGVKPKATDYRPDTYMCFSGYRRTSKMPKYFSRRSGGQLYEQVIISAFTDGVCGQKHYLTMDADGTIHPCENTVMGQSMYEVDRVCIEQFAFHATVSMAYIADSRFVWTITAHHCGAKLVMGCTAEEVKTLFNMRKGPLTATARRRPIMHLVREHIRRMQSGNEIDINPYYRGIREVVMGDTLFQIESPQVDHALARLG